jgi:uncharacterized protein (TIGR02246 family)
MKHLTKFILLLAVFALAACEQPAEPVENGAVPVQQTSADDLRAEIIAMNELWSQHHNAGDFDALAGLYAPDAIVVGPEGTYRGRDQIRADFEEGYEPGATGTVTSDRIEVASSGDLAYVFGTWSTDRGYSGDYVSVLGRRDGGWMWLTDAYNVLTTPAE